LAKQHGGYEKVGCLEKDIRNHLDKDRRLNLESGDANAMLECFMKVAIEEVIPNTRHRFCLWHIFRKVPEKLSHVIRKMMMTL
jgi:hypothetical protein